MQSKAVVGFLCTLFSLIRLYSEYLSHSHRYILSSRRNRTSTKDFIISTCTIEGKKKQRFIVRLHLKEYRHRAGKQSKATK